MWCPTFRIYRNDSLPSFKCSSGHGCFPSEVAIFSTNPFWLLLLHHGHPHPAPSQETVQNRKRKQSRNSTRTHCEWLLNVDTFHSLCDPPPVDFPSSRTHKHCTSDVGCPAWLVEIYWYQSWRAKEPPLQQCATHKRHLQARKIKSSKVPVYLNQTFEIPPFVLTAFNRRKQLAAKHIFWDCSSWNSIRQRYPLLLKLSSLCGTFWPNNYLHCGRMLDFFSWIPFTWLPGPSIWLTNLCSTHP